MVLAGVLKAEQNQAFGVSRGGRSTKIDAIVDSMGRPLNVAVTGGQVHDSQAVGEVLDTAKPSLTITADKAYDSEKVHQQIKDEGALAPLIPALHRRRAFSAGLGVRAFQPKSFGARLAAICHDWIEAPWLLEASIGGDDFAACVDKVLLPTLQPGENVIVNNLGSHEDKRIRSFIRLVGAKPLLLPKYSPDLNPIEHVFAKLKHRLRKVAARTVAAVCAAIGELLGSLTKDESTNYFNNS
jgi:transposase